jgi:hypothetical protein
LAIVVSVVAIACAIWIKLPIGAWPSPAALYWVFFCLPEWTWLLPPYGDPPEQPGPRYLIKWRRRGKKASEE